MIKTCLIVDTETTGLDPAEGAEMIEIGAILYSVEAQSTLQQFSTLVPNPSLANPQESVNRISPNALRAIHQTAVGYGIDFLTGVAQYAECIVAHNAGFDQRFAKVLNTGLPWLCTKDDFRWPQASDSRSLIAIALAHGVGVASAHRALTDCQLIAALFDRMPNLQEMFEVAMRPKALFQALVSYDDRRQASEAGFSWDGKQRAWLRRMTLEEAASLPFKTKQVADGTLTLARG